MSAGIDAAKGEILIPMDADLQNDPADISRLLDKLDEGYDVVSGWRKNRQDKLVLAKDPFADREPDHFLDRRRAAARLRLFAQGLSPRGHPGRAGSMVRCIVSSRSMRAGPAPALPRYPVDHHARTMGKSKYGISRTIKVVFDLMTIKFMAEYHTKPLYVFGAFGMIAFFISMVAGVWASGSEDC